MKSVLPVWLVAAVFTIVSTGASPAQCAPFYATATVNPDSDGPVLASCLWDSDGPGPLPASLVLGGAFTGLGDTFARGLVQVDAVGGATSPIGSGVGISAPSVGQVMAMCETSSHDLVVAGRFDAIDGVPLTNIGHWDGTAWHALGAGLPFEVRCLLALPNGDVLAGGIGTPSGDGLLRWNGSTWSNLGSSLGGWVMAMAFLPNGDLVAGGSLLLGTHSLVRWNGSNWAPFPGGSEGSVLALQVTPQGDLFVGGGFAQIGGIPAACIAKWDGSTWSSLGSGFSYAVHSLAQLPNGEVVAGGAFLDSGGVVLHRVARWDGTAWSAMGGGLGEPDLTVERRVSTLLLLPAGDLVAGGYFTTASGDRDRIARWDGSEWRQLRDGTGGAVRSSTTAANGDLVVGGDFTTFEGVAAAGVVRRVGSAWLALGSGLGGSCHAVLALANGDLVVGGDFVSAGGLSANHVARWDGSGWSAMGAGLPGIVRSLAQGPGGEILASGDFFDRIAVWDGQTWHGTGIGSSLPLLMPAKFNLATSPAGDVFASTGQYGPICRWNGQVWGPPLTVGLFPGNILAIADNGDFFTGSTGVTITAPSTVRRWNGTAWATLGATFNGAVHAILQLPDGDLLVAGVFTSNGSTVLPHLARWDGTAWQAVGGGANGVVYDLRWQGDGRVFVGGQFTRCDGVATGGFGSLASTCAASTTVAGAGCSGSGGVNVLSPISLPWLGSSYVSRAEGLPSVGIAIEVLGLAAIQQPLGAVLAQAGTGCELRSSPDLIRAYGSSASLDLTLVLPNTPSLVGASFVQQVVAIEFDATGGSLLATSSNALQAVLGSF